MLKWYSIEDYESLKKHNSDGFEIELRQSLEKHTKNKITNEYIRIKFHTVEAKEICEVIVTPSPKPVFIYVEGGKQHMCMLVIPQNPII